MSNDSILNFIDLINNQVEFSPYTRENLFKMLIDSFDIKLGDIKELDRFFVIEQERVEVPDSFEPIIVNHGVTLYGIKCGKCGILRGKDLVECVCT